MAKHPDEEITPQYREAMNMLARDLDEIFNGNKQGEDRTTSFVLLISDFNKTGRVNYISNSKRADVIMMLKEITARFEGQPEMKGHA